jgi:hypothetical protein
MSCVLLEEARDLEDGGSRFLSKVDVSLTKYMESKPKRQKCS